MTLSIKDTYLALSASSLLIDKRVEYSFLYLAYAKYAPVNQLWVDCCKDSVTLSLIITEVDDNRMNYKLICCMEGIRPPNIGINNQSYDATFFKYIIVY